MRLFWITLLMAASAFPQEHKVVIKKYVPPSYPAAAWTAQITGDVVLQLALSARGEVVASRVTSGHPLLSQAATEAVKKWRFSCSDCTRGESFSHTLTITFALGENPCNAPDYTRYKVELPSRFTVIRSKRWPDHLPCPKD